jgi:TRAP-type mannitol/chloroaromatic compound transport system substrate-binding protein/uncharacterized caspase-like protein
MVRVAVTWALLLLVVPAVALAEAEKRIALLIGNQAYTPEIGALLNPHNDVALLERTLKTLGFQVTTVRDADLASLTRAVNAYARRLAADGGQNVVGFFYYSGHGAADGATNYLIPTDVKTTETGELWDQSLRLSEITRKLRSEAGTATHFVVFDACRNTLKLRKPGTRALVQSKGFVPVMQENGMLIAYATAEGELASDVGDGAGPYAKVLADEMVKPGVEAVTMFRRVQVRVRSSIGQEPWLGFSALGEVHFAGAQSEAGKSGAPASGSSASDAERAWALAKDTTSLGVLEAFIARYKDTFYADLARARLDDLKRQQAAAAAPPKVPAPRSATEPALATPPAAGPPPPMAAQPFSLASPITLKLQDTFPANDLSSRDPLNAVLRDLTTLSGGTLKVDLLPAGKLVAAFQVLDAVSRGTLDAGWTVPSNWYGRSKAFGIFGGMVPGGMDAAAFVRWMEGEGAIELNRLIAEVTGGKARSLPCAVLGSGGDWFKKPVARIDDLKGLKFRSIALAAEVGKELGLIINYLPGGEIVSALDRGLLDGSDWSTPQSAINLGLPDVAKFLYHPGWSRPTHLFEVVVSEATWSKLGSDGQRGFESVCKQNLRRSLAMIPDLERQTLAELRNRGVTVQPYPQAVLASVRQAGQKILDVVARDDANFARVLASYNKYR